MSAFTVHRRLPLFEPGSGSPTRIGRESIRKLVVVIPALNEAGTIGSVVAAVPRQMPLDPVGAGGDSDRSRVVTRPVVDDDDLDLVDERHLARHRGDDRADRLRLVEGGDDDDELAGGFAPDPSRDP